MKLFIYRNFENVYIGWGHKYSTGNHNPSLPPPVQNEFPTGSQPPEMDDPTIEEEAALRVDSQTALEGEEGEGEEDHDENGGGDDDDENNDDEDD